MLFSQIDVFELPYLYALWFNLSHQSGTRQPLTHAPTNGAEERIERLRAGKFMGWDKTIQ